MLWHEHIGVARSGLWAPGVCVNRVSIKWDKPMQFNLKVQFLLILIWG